jgi:hypothetical protein
MILTDEGVLGRVRRLVESPGGAAFHHIEVDNVNGGVALVSSQDIRLVYH